MGCAGSRIARNRVGFRSVHSYGKTAAHNARFKLSSYAVKRPLGRRLWIASACFLLWAPTAGTAAGTSLHRSLVQVLTTANPPDVRVPWRSTGPLSRYGP